MIARTARTALALSLVAFAAAVACTPATRAEGFETSAAFTQIHGIPCWATLGAARLDRVHIPDSVTTLIFAEDNDFEGRRARRKAWAAYRPRGLTLKRMPPPSRYGDWADVVKPGA